MEKEVQDQGRSRELNKHITQLQTREIHAIIHRLYGRFFASVGVWRVFFVQFVVVVECESRVMAYSHIFYSKG